MGIARSTFYEQPLAAHDDTAIVEAIASICEEFEFYGWRRVRAELRHRGMIVNHKKIRRLMREHDLQPRRRRRYVATTDSDHDPPIYPNRTKDLTVDGPNQLWVADITHVAILGGFVYVAVILDAWSRRAVGYAISRSIDVRLTLAALNAAVERRKPPPGCVHHSDRGSQCGFKRSSQRDIRFYASHRSRALAGVAHSRVFRGRALRVAAMAVNVSALCTLRSVPFGKYWRNSPLVFSLAPRCQGL
jgi:putative transposase